MQTMCCGSNRDTAVGAQLRLQAADLARGEVVHAANHDRILAIHVRECFHKLNTNL